MRTVWKVIIHVIFLILWLFYVYTQLKKYTSEKTNRVFDTEMREFNEKEFPFPPLFRICSKKTIKELHTTPILQTNNTQNGTCVNYRPNSSVQDGLFMVVEFESVDDKISFQYLDKEKFYFYFIKVAIAPVDYFSHIQISVIQTERLLESGNLFFNPTKEIQNEYEFKLLGFQGRSIFNSTAKNIAGFLLTTQKRYFLKHEKEGYPYFEMISWILAMLGFYELLARLIIFLLSSCSCCSGGEAIQQLELESNPHDPRRLNYTLINQDFQ
jgi:hypothetical protein